MEIDIKIKGVIPVDLDLDHVVKEINEQPLIDRWKFIKQLLYGIHLKDLDNLNPGQLKLIQDFLQTELKLFT